ncbi:GNAT family N-acetyltransferase [Serratia liquefaciens]|uniref:GNAT family N-acetyltransferase n=1 Tax=Serratia liquefaciens TaxID=614 RepID=UPI00165D0BA1|nr:GNAT family N-acetyltransferase [Serratia liquefaciens]QNQ55434.1 GNAT family N-acetyltransferase [Serratia liquefaciens]
MKSENLTLHYDNDIRAFLEGKLDEFNSEFMGLNNHEYCVYIKDDAEKIVAGLYGGSYGSVFYIHYLWIDEDQRGRRLGHHLLDSAESHARKLGCASISVDTFSFQAPNFYLKHDFRTIGVLDCGNEIARYYLNKSL